MSHSHARSAIRTASITWLLLIGATLVAWSLGHGAFSGHRAATLAKCGVIVTAFAKVWLVGFQFMELRNAPRLLRHAFDAWSAGACVLLILIITA